MSGMDPTPTPPPGWDLVDGRLRRELEFPDFATAFGFMTSVAIEAQAMDHHPNWSNEYARVTVELWSHDVGAVTDRDLRLARRINELSPP